MPAFGGGGRPIGSPNSMSSTVDLPEGDGEGSRPRSLDQIFPLRGDANRSGEMQATWRSFGRDHLDAVKVVLDTGRSPPEIAYRLGELLHNHFRSHGVTLTSYELRRLVAELLALHGPADESREPGEAPARVAAPSPIAGKESPAAKTQPDPPLVVAFEREATQPWPGDEPPAPSPSVAEKALEPPPSPIVTMTPRESAPFERLLARALELAAARLATHGRQAARAAVDEAIATVAGEQGGLSEATREGLAAAAFSEVAGLGLIDRLWADRSVSAVFVHGPHTIFVERDGVLHAVTEGFRDAAHLLELVTRVAGRPASGMADFWLRDGSSGLVILPPAAPSGPVLALRRVAPGQVTLENLVSSGLIDRPVAEVLRLGLRSRLNMLVSGPRGCGKTAVLAALVRDSEGRVVTVARHRHFQWPMASKIELVASSSAPFAALVAAAGRLEPGLVALDGVQLEDVVALSERLLRGPPATVAAVGPEVMSAALARSVDLVVRIDRADDGLFRVVAVEDSAGAPIFRHENGVLSRGTGTPSFAATVQARGLGGVLSKLFA